MFDGQAYLAGCQPPAFKDHQGVVHTGVVVSLVEIQPLLPGIAKLAGRGWGPEESEAFLQFVRDVCQVAHLPAEALLALPENAVVDALVDILGCLRGRPAQASADAAPVPAGG